MSNANKNRKHVEVLVASTVPVVWEEVVMRDNMATQKRNSADADCIAFLLTRRGNARSVITHFAKVKSTNNNASIKQHLEKHPRVKEYSIKNKKGWEKALYHKEYYLDKLKELPNPNGTKWGQPPFYLYRYDFLIKRWLTPFSSIFLLTPFSFQGIQKIGSFGNCLKIRPPKRGAPPLAG